jgi:hypothetical protein
VVKMADVEVDPKPLGSVPVVADGVVVDMCEMVSVAEEQSAMVAS